MALTNTCVRFLVWAKKQHVSFDRTLTLGHLENFCEQSTLEPVLQENGTLINTTKINWKDKYADSFFTGFGAHSVESLDHNDYEQALFQHDLNLPLPSHLSEKYSLIVDGGTLEHVFNFPQAIKNCMQALTLGGHFIGFSPANNMMGHGFYQFSPEMFYRVFSKENGFEIKGLFLVAAGFDIDTDTWYEVKDPKELGQRVTLTNSLPTYLMVLAKKIAVAEPFNHPVYQSDYIHNWENGQADSGSDTPPKLSLFKRILRKLTGQSKTEENLERINGKFFKKIKP